MIAMLSKSYFFAATKHEGCGHAHRTINGAERCIPRLIRNLENQFMGGSASIYRHAEGKIERAVKWSVRARPDSRPRPDKWPV